MEYFFDVEQVGTNSHVEGWHNHLKKLLRKPHPWVYWIYLTRTDGGYISFFVTGWCPPQRMKCAIIKDLKINKVKTQFNNNSKSLEEHVHGISNFSNFKLFSIALYNIKIILVN